MLKRLFSFVFVCFALIFGTLSAASAYTVTYNCGEINGMPVTGTPPATITYTESFRVAHNTCDVPSGYLFVGWLDDFGLMYDAGVSTKIYATTNLVAQYAQGKFIVTTAGENVKFYMSASGIFTVDCGTGGTLSGNGVSGNTIDRTSNTNEDEYMCTYNTGGQGIITFDGIVTGYSTSAPVISFSKRNNGGQYMCDGHIRSIVGNLSDVFPELGSAANHVPLFGHAWAGCTSLDYISPDLFSNYTKGRSNMFASAFEGCKRLESIPSNLFGSFTTGASYMFDKTFSNCTGLKSLPSDLFVGFITGAEGMFTATFSGCTGLTSIPSELFHSFPENISGRKYMFRYTFENCTGITSIPADLFNKFTTGAESMFERTFYRCTGITSIPPELFSYFSENSTGYTGLFMSTFSGCTGITSIPEGLFNKFTKSAESMFYGTFSGCTGITSIPPELFASFPENTAARKNVFKNTFNGCAGITSIPAGLFNKFTTSAESMFSGTFKGCTGITSIPPELFASFSDNSIVYTSGFESTFEGCTGITSIPEGLFNKFTKSAESMFSGTFKGCTGITSIPPELFASFSDNSIVYASGFESTFEGCTGITSIPADLFNKFTRVATGVKNAFGSTFKGCTALQSIPSQLFEKIRNPREAVFKSTFEGCTGLTSLPSELFSNVISGEKSAFQGTFKDCTGLTGYIPANFFAGLIANNVKYSTDMMKNIFTNTGLDTSCPSGTVNYPTGYESYWDGHVSCTPERVVTYLCGSGTGNPPANETIGELLSFTPAENTCTAPTDYAFNGWLISDTDNIVKPNNSFTWNYTENKTLTAQWRSTLVNLNWFDGDEELTVNSEAQMCRYGTVISFPTNEMKKTGYHFLGWIGKGE